jgi:hypothetical protein
LACPPGEPAASVGVLGDVVDEDDGGAGGGGEAARGASDPAGHLVVVLGRDAVDGEGLGDAVEDGEGVSGAEQLLPGRLLVSESVWVGFGSAVVEACGDRIGIDAEAEEAADGGGCVGLEVEHQHLVAGGELHGCFGEGHPGFPGLGFAVEGVHAAAVEQVVAVGSGEEFGGLGDVGAVEVGGEVDAGP